MNIALGSDHHGVEYKEFIKQHITGYTWIDVGSHSTVPSDYPIYAHAVIKELMSGNAQQGILLCGTGVGMAIAANRCPGVYAGLAWNEEIARLNKEHDNVNVLVIPADYVTELQVVAMVRTWLQAPFLGGRHQDRIDLIDRIVCE
jgi:ribose 5-phosphate isomerase B